MGPQIQSNQRDLWPQAFLRDGYHPCHVLVIVLAVITRMSNIDLMLLTFLMKKII
jgi:hypothetical protein